MSKPGRAGSRRHPVRGTRRHEQAIIHRWIKRQQEEADDRKQWEIDTLVNAGGGKYARKKLAKKHVLLGYLKAKKKAEERRMLEATSIKDMIGK